MQCFANWILERLIGTEAVIDQFDGLKVCCVEWPELMDPNDLPLVVLVG